MYCDCGQEVSVRGAPRAGYLDRQFGVRGLDYMRKMTKPWNYLIVTAANDRQAKAYDLQIQQRQEAGEISQVRNCLVIADADGRRVGSGGSTFHCLWSVLRRERLGAGPSSFEEAEAILSALRILIVHAGGDSRRLPAYSHCGKMFVPLPAKGQSSTTLFDQLVPTFLTLPESPAGQVVVASGDALILFDAWAVNFNRPGITALGSFTSAGVAAHHGVFCSDKNGSVRRFLQKPSPHVQVTAGAVNDGEAILDLGIMSCGADAAVRLMRAFFHEDSEVDGTPVQLFKPQAHAAMFSHGIDLYREVCCALGKSCCTSAGSAASTTMQNQSLTHNLARTEALCRSSEKARIGSHGLEAYGSFCGTPYLG